MSTVCTESPGEITNAHPQSTSLRQWMILVPAMVLPFFGALVYFNLLAGTKLAMVMYTGVKLFTLFFPVTIWFMERRRRSSEPTFHSKSLGEGVISGLVICGVLLVMFVYTALGDTVLMHRRQILEGMTGLGVASYYIPFCAFLSVAHSLLEEYYWRWFVWKRLDAVVPGIGSHLLAALAFSLHHYVVLAGFFGLGWSLLFGTLVGVGGFIWSLQYKRTGSLLGSWISHLLVDAVVMGVGYFIVFG